MISCVQQFIVNPLLVSVGGVRWSRFVACSATYGESLRFRFALRWLEFDVPSATYGGTLRRDSCVMIVVDVMVNFYGRVMNFELT